MGGVDEVALQERADVGGEDAVEEQGELEAERGGDGQKPDDGGQNDECGKERDHRRVRGRLGEVEEIVPGSAHEGALQQSGNVEEASHGIAP